LNTLEAPLMEKPKLLSTFKTLWGGFIPFPRAVILSYQIPWATVWCHSSWTWKEIYGSV
jgi:hypothetical protein